MSSKCWSPYIISTLQIQELGCRRHGRHWQHTGLMQRLTEAGVLRWFVVLQDGRGPHMHTDSVSTGALAWPQLSVVGKALKGRHAQSPTLTNFCSVFRCPIRFTCSDTSARITRTPPIHPHRPWPIPRPAPRLLRCTTETEIIVVACPPSSCSLLALTICLCSTSSSPSSPSPSVHQFVCYCCSSTRPHSCTKLQLSIALRLCAHALCRITTTRRRFGSTHKLRVIPAAQTPL
jgi:hypothetical protein